MSAQGLVSCRLSFFLVCCAWLCDYSRDSHFVCLFFFCFVIWFLFWFALVVILVVVLVSFRWKNANVKQIFEFTNCGRKKTIFFQLFPADSQSVQKTPTISPFMINLIMYPSPISCNIGVNPNSNNIKPNRCASFNFIIINEYLVFHMLMIRSRHCFPSSSFHQSP